MGIGERIRLYRTAKNLKVKELAEKIGISQGTLSDIENEKTKPSCDTLCLIAEHTDIDPTWLLTGQGGINNSPGTYRCLKCRQSSGGERGRGRD